MESLRREREEPQPGSARLLWKLLEKQTWSKEISGCLCLNPHTGLSRLRVSLVPSLVPWVAEMCCDPLLGRDGEEERNFQCPGNGGRIR